jgi:DNA repair protein RadA/Sms
LVELTRGEGTPQRLSFALPETLRVLGGGLVPGATVLIAGEPGIGKSTLLLQIGCAVASRGVDVVYVAGEESPYQIGLRAQRLGLEDSGLKLIAEVDVDAALTQLDRLTPGLILVDSIQALTTQDGVGSTAGSVAQVRECAARLIAWAKANRVSIVMTGHVTKEGSVAGPRVLEHAVDTVLYLEGDGYGPFRVLRGIKNRFGSTNEIAVFEMGEAGLTEVADPSSALLAERPQAAPGSVVVPLVEGSRPLLVEVQALVTPSVGAEPRRSANGIDMGRLILIAAVLSRRAGLPLGRHDVIVSAVGGLRVTEPAADLAIALAIASSLRDIALPHELAAVGEIGLTGEVRRVSQVERRIAEAARLGFRKLLVPASTVREGLAVPPGVDVVPVSTVHQAISETLNTPAVSPLEVR